MSNYLTVPAAPPDSPTMCRARLASGKHIHLYSQMQTLDSYHHFTEVSMGAHRDQTLYFVCLTRQLSQNSKHCRKHVCCSQQQLYRYFPTDGNMFACACWHVNRCVVSF